jgi:hypothetical protein
MRLTGFNARFGAVYDFIGRPLEEDEERDDGPADAEKRAPNAKTGDNAPANPSRPGSP